MTATTAPTTVYAAAGSRMPPLGPYLQDLWQRRALIRHVSRTNLKAQHYDTVLGQIWLVLGPLLLALVYLTMRTVLLPAGEGAERNALIDHIVLGVFFFRYAAGTLTTGANSILANRPLILNMGVTRGVFPVVTIVESVLTFLPALGVYFVLHAALGRPFGAPLALLPVVVALLTVFNFGLVLLSSTATVYFRDTTNILTYFTRVWLFISPVLYTVEEIPAHLLSWLRWNPLYAYFGALGSIVNAEWPKPGFMLACVAWALVAFVPGVIIFLRRERDFAIRL